MTTDDRIENISQQLEIITGMQLAAERRMEEQDARERQARAALLTGIAAYLKALSGGEEKQGT